MMIMMQIERELRDICSDVLNVLSKHLIPSATMAEAKVFYNKMYVTCTVLVICSVFLM